MVLQPKAHTEVPSKKITTQAPLLTQQEPEGRLLVGACLNAKPAAGHKENFRFHATPEL